ncbi:MAG: PfkB family carbohydrate kinase [Dehalococcoidia bacterium]
MGNVVEDSAGRSWRPGGPALFSAVLASRLEWDVTLFTSLTIAYDRTLFQDITIRSMPSSSVPRFENIHHAGSRRQRLLARGSVLPKKLTSQAAGLPADVFLVAPALDEVSARLQSPAPVSGMALQGALRRVGADAWVEPVPDALAVARGLLSPDQIAFLSEQDTRAPDELAVRLAEAGTPVFVTRGPEGASLYSGCERSDYAALKEDEVDPTGAGDCFATAFLLRFAETSQRTEAIRYALAAGALAVTAPGVDGVPSRGEIESLLRRSAA